MGQLYDSVRIIPCNEIQSETNRLFNRFRNCTVLEAKDLKDLTSLMYSISLCGVDGAFMQNNFIKVITTKQHIVGVGTSISNVINTGTPFTVEDTDNIIFKIPLLKGYSEQGVTALTGYYFLKDAGAGTYGMGELQITDDNLFWIRDEYLAILGNGQNVIVYDLNTTNESNYNSNPEIILNANAGSFNITSNNDYYFRITFTPLGPLNPTPAYKIYRFKGPVGTYGFGGGSTSALADFVLMGEESNMISGHIKIKNIDIREILADNVKIHTAVNTYISSGPMSTINIPEKTIMSFSIRKNIYVDGVAKITLDKYFWTKGGGVISSNSQPGDYLLYEKETLGMISPTIPAPPIFQSLEVMDVNNPSGEVNNATISFVKNSSQDTILALFDKRIENDNVPKFKMYSITGADGTYGLGGITSVPSDFQMILDDDSTLPAIYDIEAGTNITIDKTNPSKPIISSSGGGGLPITATSDILNDGEDGTSKFLEIKDVIVPHIEVVLLKPNNFVLDLIDNKNVLVLENIEMTINPNTISYPSSFMVRGKVDSTISGNIILTSSVGWTYNINGTIYTSGTFKLRPNEMFTVIRKANLKVFLIEGNIQ